MTDPAGDMVDSAGVMDRHGGENHRRHADACGARLGG